jgi:ferredoxin--NADP+ reductase
MDKFRRERVLSVHHWNEDLFSFRTTRDPGLRFENGQFIMVGLEHEGRPLMRAYSIASANWEEELEFFSIKVQDGPLTSKLQHIQVGDEIMLSKKPTGTLLITDLNPGPRLYLLATGTGLAPFISIIKDPETYERFETVILTHGVRRVSDLAYHDFITKELPEHEYLGEMVRKQLRYYPSVTREPYRHQGRLTELLATGKLCKDLGLPPINPEHDRAMICGSPSMLADFRHILDEHSFQVSKFIGDTGDYVYERAFVES